MQTFSVPGVHSAVRMRPRTALVVSADRNFRQRLYEILSGLRWQVREAEGGAGAWTEAQSAAPEAVIVDSWLPDLDVGEFIKDFRALFPEVDLMTADGAWAPEGPRGPHHQELLYALRRSQESDTAAWNAAPELSKSDTGGIRAHREAPPASVRSAPASKAEVFSLVRGTVAPEVGAGSVGPAAAAEPSPARGKEGTPSEPLPELVGNAACMLEVSRRIRLVAPRATPVLIEGPTGSGKELVAEALHRLSTRSRKPFVAINCAAIPEALLEAELFGHTRGAFTGAVNGRIGRIESADGGTLFLDEIGEMPPALQSKLLRFVENGELQRVGNNENVKVDVRIIAATHCPLVQHMKVGTFRADLYYRLAVFLIRTPSLTEHTEDLPLLVEHFLKKMGRLEPVKRIDAAALAKLETHPWPGNVRELEHVLERAAILAGDASSLTSQDIDFGLTGN